MLIKEILHEQKKDDVVDDLMDLFVTCRQKGKDTILINGDGGVISYLRNRGHYIDTEGLMSMKIADNHLFSSIVSSVNSDSVELKQPDSTDSSDKSDHDISAEKVAKGAATGAKNIIKSGGRV
jgi:hypothetical protein